MTIPQNRLVSNLVMIHVMFPSMEGYVVVFCSDLVVSFATLQPLWLSEGSPSCASQNLPLPHSTQHPGHLPHVQHAILKPS